MKHFRLKSLEEITAPALVDLLSYATPVESIAWARSGGPSLTEECVLHLRRLGIPEPVRELRFHPSRRWRFDLAWPAWKLAVEVDGGTYARGRASGHTSITGMARDREKDAEAAILGWTVIRIDAVHVKAGTGADWVRRWIKGNTL